MQDIVLLVEDRPGTFKKLSARLGADDIQVLDAFGIDRALDTAQQFLPNLVVFELGAPKGDGLADLERMAEFCRAQQVPVVFVSAEDCDSFRDLTREHGVLGFFPEPYEIDDLLMVIHMALARTRVNA